MLYYFESEEMSRRFYEVKIGKKIICILSDFFYKYTKKKILGF
jgi:hypothetical protein